jgi:hypothetical protein
MTEQGAKGLLERARNRRNAVKSYHFTMRGPAEGSQAGETIAEGDVQRPDKARFQVEGGTLLSTGEQLKDEIVQYEGDEYIKKGATDKYELMPFGAEGDLIYGVWGMMSPWTFDAASGFAEEVLFQGYEQIDGVETARILFTYDSSKLMARVAKGLGTPGPMTTGPIPQFAEACIDPQTGKVLRFRFQVLGMMVGQGTPWSGVTLDYSRFDDPAMQPIERPVP